MKNRTRPTNHWVYLRQTENWGSWKELFCWTHGTQAKMYGLSTAFQSLASLNLLQTHCVTLGKSLPSLGLCFIRKSGLNQLSRSWSSVKHQNILESLLRIRISCSPPLDILVQIWKAKESTFSTYSKGEVISQTQNAGVPATSLPALTFPQLSEYS